MSGPRLAPAASRVLGAVSELSGEGPVTLGRIAERLGGHPNTTRQQLDRLVAAGHLVAGSHPRKAPGRPPRVYSITDRGRRALGVDPYRGFVGAVTSHLASLPDPTAAARTLGTSWGEAAVAGSPPREPVGTVVELLDILGFEPRPAGHGDDVVLTRCPLRDDGDQGVVCEVHRGMLDGALRSLGDSQGVQLTPYSHPDGRGVSVR